MNNDFYENINYILLIMNCEKYNFKSQKQKETWLNFDNIKPIQLYFHVIGNINLDKNYNFDFENNILYIKVEDDYISLPKKVIRSFEAILDKFKNIKYVFKTDDDQNLINYNFLNTLIKFLNNKQPKIHYGGKILNIEAPFISQYYKIHKELPNNLIINPTIYCNGRFYFLSFDALNFLINNKINIEKEYFEDYSIGLNLDNIFKQKIGRAHV